MPHVVFNNTPCPAASPELCAAVSSAQPSGAITANDWSIGPEPVEVPDLIGDSTGQAEQALNALGLLMAVSGDTVEVPIASGLIGNVAEQSPGQGTIAEVGSTVTVKLGVAQQVVVPNLEGMTSAEAQAAATAVGLNVDLTGTTVTNNQALDDTVASQDPAAGTSVDEGSFISIVVYTYQPDVPDFTGMTVAEAQTQATAVGLGTVTQVGTVETPDAGLVGTIESQTPLAGTSVATGTNIDVIVFVAAP